MKPDYIEKGSFSWTFFSFVPRGKSCLGYHPLRGDCNTGQWETHLLMRNKEVCFAYQLLTTSRVAFGCCCLWFCRCMPSNDSRVMDPFPRRLHWNILTVTFAKPLKTAASSCWHICVKKNSSHLTIEHLQRLTYACREYFKGDHVFNSTFLLRSLVVHLKNRWAVVKVQLKALLGVGKPDG